MDDVIVLEERPTRSGLRIGVAMLDAPAALNALSLAMVRALAAALDRWEADPRVAAVFLRGAGSKAFCAGGDLHELYAGMRALPGEPSAHARLFFAEEYALNYRIHTFPKPIVCWGHGIVMGGGLGLMVGASHRVVTEASRLAMPEVAIGLYPDVGASFFLRRMPGRVGLFLALTGASLNANDALWCGLADHIIEDGCRDDVLASLGDSPLRGEAHGDRAEISRVLSRHETRRRPSSKVCEHFELVSELVAGEDLVDIANRIRALRREDAWLATAATTFAKGSPVAAALAFELWRRAKHASLADVLRLEYDVSVACTARHDFAEGIRALLVDKDRRPRWSRHRIEDVTAAEVEEHLRLRTPHPLAMLGAQVRPSTAA